LNGEATSAWAEAVLMMRPQCLRAFIRQRGADGVEGGGQVDRDDLVPFLDRELLDRRDELDAGIVDEDVDRAELGLGLATMAAISSGLVMSAGE
jgi:hypothetical protein